MNCSWNKKGLNPDGLFKDLDGFYTAVFEYNNQAQCIFTHFLSSDLIVFIIMLLVRIDFCALGNTESLASWNWFLYSNIRTSQKFKLNSWSHQILKTYHFYWDALYVQSKDMTNHCSVVMTCAKLSQYIENLSLYHDMDEVFIQSSCYVTMVFIPPAFIPNH